MTTQKALLIVDPQNDFGHLYGSLYVTGSEKLIPIWNSLLETARIENRMILISGDQHPLQTTHFKKFGGIWPVHCVKGTWGAQFVAGLEIRPEYCYIAKAMGESEDGYSPLCENAFVMSLKFNEPSKATTYLKAYGITDIYIGGLATDYCVKAGVLHARKMGLNTFLITDAVAAVNLKPGDGDRAIKEMTDAGAVLTTAAEVDLG